MNQAPSSSTPLPAQTACAPEDFALPLYYSIGFALMVFAISTVLMIPVFALIPGFNENLVETAGGLVFQGVALLGFAITYRKYYPNRVLAAMAWVRPASSRLLLGVTLVIYPAMEWVSWHLPGIEADIGWMFSISQGVPIPLLILSIVILAPLVEELFFRQMLWQSLEHKWHKPWLTCAITSALWAIIHTQYSMWAVAYIFTNGLLLGFLRHKGGSILPCIGLHMLMNLIATLSLFYGWGPYGEVTF